MHPVITAMNTVGFDAATIGNHEFNYGLDFLMKSAAGADFPDRARQHRHETGAATRATTRRSSNPMSSSTGHLTDGSGQSHPIKVGVIGFTPPQVMNWDRKHLEGNVRPATSSPPPRPGCRRCRRQAPTSSSPCRIPASATAEPSEGMENASVPARRHRRHRRCDDRPRPPRLPLAHLRSFAAVDAAKGTIHGKPAVMGGFWGSHLGVIDLLLERDGNEWRVRLDHFRGAADRAAQRGPTVTALVEDDQAVLAATEAEHEETLAYVRRAVGKTSAPLHSYFALVADDPSVQIVSIAQTWYIAQMMQGTEYEDLPILSAAAPFKAGGRGGPDYYTDVPAGNVAIKNVADLYLYPNTVRAVKVTGAAAAATGSNARPACSTRSRPVHWPTSRC